ncbi:MAG: UDP-N-acetylmuramoyl-tripeptide--D-alanyl-D-alanine ligase [Hydrogenothermaceae bacterium]|nr:UDP-N-acetylmuramoyl-tripeptide--D-alanyl-D-alanine ligase [Hydrogenothermaceae bacterium]
MKFSELRNLLNGEFLNFSQDFEIEEFTIDSRKATENSVFIPLKSNRDGHEFIQDALKNGSKGYLSERVLPYKNGILVRDSYRALVQIAKFKRSIPQTVIGITGSSGKTSTKELINFTLSGLYKTYATKGNLNNEIGVPLTLSNIPKDTQIAIIEKGAGKKDDIKYLMDISNPDIGVLVSLGEAHIERFGSFDNIVKTKGQIFDGVKFGILPSNLNHYYRDKDIDFITFGDEGIIRLSGIQITEDGTEGVISYKSDRIRLKIPIYSKAVFRNIGAVAGVLYALELNPIKNLEILRQFKGFEGRGDIKKIGRYLILDESYNANPSSVKNSIESFEKLPGVKVYVMGDMLELGDFSEKLHLEVAKTFERSKIDYILLFGREVEHIQRYLQGKKKVFIFQSKREIGEFLEKLEYLDIKVMVKGSRGMKMEEVIEYLREKAKEDVL